MNNRRNKKVLAACVYKKAVDYINEHHKECTTAEFIPDYSGRFMFGEQTPAIVIHHPQFTAVLGLAICSALKWDSDETLRFLPQRDDDFGKGKIYY